jgi:hypothetical protein
MDTLKAKMVQALAQTYGRVTDAAKIVDIDRTTHYRWLKEDEEYKAAVESVGEVALDFVEGKLFELIEGAEREVMTEAGPIMLKETPNPTACIFYLKTKGKKRGYVERQEITGADGGAVTIVLSDV